MQSDGNIVIYAENNVAVWASNSDRTPGSHLELTDDGVLTLRGPRGTEIWAGTYSSTLLCGQTLMPGMKIDSHNGLYHLAMNSDGNLVLTGPGGTKWESRTTGHPGARLELREDGYIAIYDRDNHEISLDAKPFPDAAFPDATLEMQNDGNLVFFNSSHHGEWASDTPAS